MKEKIITFVKHPLISGSGIIVAGNFVANIFNWLFNLLVGGRGLISVSDYGLYSAIISFLVLFGIIFTSFQGIFAKFTAKYTAGNNKAGMYSILLIGRKYILTLSAAVFLILLLSTYWISNFLKVTDLRILLFAYIAILFTLFTALPYGVLQGKMQFVRLSLISILGPVVKIIVALLLVWLGFRLIGVMAAVAIAGAATFSVAYINIRKYKNASHESKSANAEFIKAFKGYSFRFFLATFGITFMMNADTILVRHLFPSVISGQYAALSLMGKAILYSTSPIYAVFFPLIAQKHERKEKVYNTLFLGGMMIVGISLCFSMLYFLYPNLILQIFFPTKEYLALKNYLGIFSVYIIIISLANLLNNFLLSIGKQKVYVINIAMMCLFTILFFMFHENITQIIYILITTSFLLFLSLFVYLLKNENP